VEGNFLRAASSNYKFLAKDTYKGNGGASQNEAIRFFARFIAEL
jgi:hypothetical protein